MSRCLLIVLVPPKYKTQDEILAQVDSLMDPYNATMHKVNYEEPCSCIGSQARQWAARIADSELGEPPSRIAGPSLEELFEAIRSGEKVEIKLIDPADTDEEEERRLQMQRDHADRTYYRPRLLRIRELLKQHNLKDRPDPLCTTCNGTGNAKKFYNPQGKWDGMTIGGVFSGCLTDQMDSTAYGNLQPCWMCRQKKTDTERHNAEPINHTAQLNEKTIDIIKHFSALQQEGTPCMVCRGTGYARPLYQDQHQKAKNIMPMATIHPPIPYALLTPDGKWHSEMALFSDIELYFVSPSDETYPIWEDHVLTCYANHLDHTAVAVEIHC